MPEEEKEKKEKANSETTLNETEKPDFQIKSGAKTVNIFINFESGTNTGGSGDPGNKGKGGSGDPADKGKGGSGDPSDKGKGS